jgi:hypothetical protein
MIGLGSTRRQVQSVDGEDAAGWLGNGMDPDDDDTPAVAGAALGRRIIEEEDESECEEEEVRANGTKTTGEDGDVEEADDDDDVDKAPPLGEHLFNISGMDDEGIGGGGMMEGGRSYY